jgi:hypothetical protein
MGHGAGNERGEGLNDNYYRDMKRLVVENKVIVPSL